ncbi:hypothetical protein HFN76_28125 [Rhizobium laguerreae]|uniref:hypothetical protein n=1 Tax=Rhizobium laguerreae TaxID=1076926 RepID=UPI001C90FE3B|nr:hypothetical protein [Rhizobium laguerreae]MBY3516050.1 hypothetical protein [Rhizobium laguerreae]
MRLATVFSLINICTIAGCAGMALAGEASTGPYANENEYLKERSDRTTFIDYQYAVGVVRAVELQVSDQVDDKCLTNTSALSARIRAQLENAGIAVYNEPFAASLPTNPRLMLSVLGFKVGNGPCVASVTMSMEYSSDTNLGSLAYTNGLFRVLGQQVMWRNSSLFSRGGNVNEAILSQVQEWTDSLTADIAKAKRDPNVQKFLTSWPNEPPMTEREFKVMMEEELSKVRQ